VRYTQSAVNAAYLLCHSLSSNSGPVPQEVCVPVPCDTNRVVGDPDPVFCHDQRVAETCVPDPAQEVVPRAVPCPYNVATFKRNEDPSPVEQTVEHRISTPVEQWTSTAIDTQAFVDTYAAGLPDHAFDLPDSCPLGADDAINHRHLLYTESDLPVSVIQKACVPFIVDGVTDKPDLVPHHAQRAAVTDTQAFIDMYSAGLPDHAFDMSDADADDAIDHRHLVYTDYDLSVSVLQEACVPFKVDGTADEPELVPHHVQRVAAACIPDPDREHRRDRNKDCGRRRRHKPRGRQPAAAQAFRARATARQLC